METVQISKFTLIKKAIDEVNIQIATLQALDVDYDIIDELTYKRTQLGYDLIAEINKNN